MGITSLQVCMDSSDWLQGTITGAEGAGMDHSSSSPITGGTPSGEDMLACSRPLIERRLRPQHEQALKCPRCESTHTKFCYYNNYSLSQPRYFCKTCRRYWTKGGTLRNIPVGGGCRKNKKVSSSSKKPSSSHDDNNNNHSPISPTTLILNAQNNVFNSNNNNNNNNGNFNNPTELQLAFPEMPFSLFNTESLNPSFLLDHTAATPVDYMDNKYEALVGAGGHDFLGNAENFGGGIINTSGLMAAANSNVNFHGVCNSPFMFDQYGSTSSNGNNILESCQRLMIGPSSYDNHQHHFDNQNNNDHVDDVKPNAKILSLEWNDNNNHQHQQACNSDAGYNFGGLGSWTGLMNGYGPSATNPLV